MEDVVSEDERDRVAADVLLTEDERLGQAVGAGLLGVGDADAELGAVAEQALEARRRRAVW